MKEFLEYIRKFNIKALVITPTKNEWIRLLRYSLVGGVSTVFDWGIVFFSSEIGVHYLVSAVLGFVIGLLVNYLLSKSLVFSKANAKVNSAVEILIYASIGFVGLLITMGLMYLLTDKMGIWYMASKMIATVVVLLWNYMGRRFLYK